MNRYLEIVRATIQNNYSITRGPVREIAWDPELLHWQNPRLTLHEPLDPRPPIRKMQDPRPILHRTWDCRPALHETWSLPLPCELWAPPPLHQPRQPHQPANLTRPPWAPPCCVSRKSWPSRGAPCSSWWPIIWSFHYYGVMTTGLLWYKCNLRAIFIWIDNKNERTSWQLRLWEWVEKFWGMEAWTALGNYYFACSKM